MLPVCLVSEGKVLFTKSLVTLVILSMLQFPEVNLRLVSVWAGGTAGNVDSLFQSLDHVSRAVGTLVNIMTDDEATDGQGASPTTAPRAGPSRGPHK